MSSKIILKNFNVGAQCPEQNFAQKIISMKKVFFVGFSSILMGAIFSLSAFFLMQYALEMSILWYMIGIAGLTGAILGAGIACIFAFKERTN
ncbi:MAG: hypothetical protein LBI69_00270 [Puniceicoccales bacterium]|jgi:hypothetical protein|nr:hypothetical protein [Puniceicoccales bacterium]